MSIFHKIYEDLQHVCYIWRREMQQVVKDEGILIFFFVVPIAYPLLYSWIYNNETVREVPVCVVDMSNTGLSREFVRKCDASPDVRVAYYAQDLDEGISLVSRQLVKGIYFIPPDFENNILRMKQGIISVYCDMSLMLTYKAIYQTSMLVSMEMGKDILQVELFLVDRPPCMPDICQHKRYEDADNGHCGKRELAGTRILDSERRL